MEFALLIKELEQKGITCLADEPMSRHTSFRIGGPAAVMAQPANENELLEAYTAARNRDIPVLLIGNGSNLLVSDSGLKMLVIKTFDNFSKIEVKEDCIYAQSGALLSRIAVAAQQHGLTGFEFAHGIPGTLGGAVVMNAGAYGGEIKDVVISTDYLDKKLERRIMYGGEHDFSYRHSAFSNCESVILSSIIKLSEGNKEEIKARMQELSEKRKKSQPLDMPSAGSAFKRPVNGYAAAMIEQAGLKGFSIGGAQVSEKHSGFIVNRGGATALDVLRLMDEVKRRVYEHCGAELEAEIKMVGSETW